jgi:hypothetical protein
MVERAGAFYRVPSRLSLSPRASQGERAGAFEKFSSSLSPRIPRAERAGAFRLFPLQ